MIPSVRFGSIIQVKEVFWNSLHPEETRWAGTSPEASEHLLEYSTGTVSEAFEQQLTQADDDFRKSPQLRIVTDDDAPEKGLLLLTGTDALALGVAKLKRIFAATPSKTATIEVAIPEWNQHHQFTPTGITFDA